MVPTVLLFDIDGTLLDSAGAGRRAMRAAFDFIAKKKDACEHFSFAGMTDQAIAREGLRFAGHDPTPAAIDALIEAYLERLETELVQSANYRVLPGVPHVLEKVTMDDVAVGLGTGNVRRGAFAKLGRGKIAHPFSFGGFGCDAEDRAELLAFGLKRGAQALGVPKEECRVVVIGDTPKDVSAAKAIGAMCIGVGTGGFAPSELKALGAEHAFDTLDHPDVVDLLLGR